MTVLLSSCKSDGELNGVWVGPYRGNPFQNQPTVSRPYILSLQNGSFKAEGLHFSNDFGVYSYSSKDFEFNDEGPLEFASAPNADSIAFKGTEKDPYPIIFRRLPDSLKSDSYDRVKLIGKKYTFDGIKDSDTLFFKNDSILSFSNWPTDTFYKRFFFEGYDVIFISDVRIPPLFIRGENETKLKVTSYPKKLKNVTLQEI
ncbi:hypothetical protein [Gilvibacter sediminis]|uniref:hypothetical protein n=1 Tax=Gilvibacter sediminis TaxID=379071 RepID=UPI0023504375|nr:hypothetical protein [Gilvibacter sediminis]MDC7997986.1 hypothetical protein [Gilvibacter sediminis]